VKAKYSGLLVVDASVARSAGETENPMSSRCREALLSILKICHRIIMTEAIREEWHEHARTSARKWLVRMYARKKVHWCEGMQLSHVDEACEELSAGEQDGLRKDLCLVEGACARDGIIVTRDDAIVVIWGKCHHRFRLAKPIQWVNPLTDGVQALERL
jgi:hypothetical protein